MPGARSCSATRSARTAATSAFYLARLLVQLTLFRAIARSRGSSNCCIGPLAAGRNPLLAVLLGDASAGCTSVLRSHWRPCVGYSRRGSVRITVGDCFTQHRSKIASEGNSLLPGRDGVGTRMSRTRRCTASCWGGGCGCGSRRTLSGESAAACSARADALARAGAPACYVQIPAMPCRAPLSRLRSAPHSA